MKLKLKYFATNFFKNLKIHIFFFPVLKFYNYSLEALKMTNFLYFWNYKAIYKSEGITIVEEYQMLKVDMPTLYKCLIVYSCGEGSEEKDGREPESLTHVIVYLRFFSF